jgi:thiol-disulfide isomerase/thioredoxin
MMKGRRDCLSGLAGAAVVSIGALPKCASAQTAPAGESASFGWPPITLLDGTVWAPESWSGQAGVILLWATWCAFCRRHNPHVEKLWQAVRARPLRVLGVSIDRDPEVVRQHAREHGYTFPITLGEDALRARLTSRRVLPTTVTFDRRGRLLQRIPGEMFEDDVLALARLADGPA